MCSVRFVTYVSGRSDFVNQTTMLHDLVRLIVAPEPEATTYPIGCAYRGARGKQHRAAVFACCQIRTRYASMIERAVMAPGSMAIMPAALSSRLSRTAWAIGEKANR